jgi:hypothetical protein
MAPLMFIQIQTITTGAQLQTIIGVTQEVTTTGKQLQTIIGVTQEVTTTGIQLQAITTGVILVVTTIGIQLEDKWLVGDITCLVLMEPSAIQGNGNVMELVIVEMDRMNFIVRIVQVKLWRTRNKDLISSKG